ncbi:MAG2-interacting protein 2 [Camellia lanceoleosa]|uniref:MAG2-interacting protein 2 n=1 Tax=Camellia lanceoleosa TaxID=1840588 RepID=A0ACC0IRK8_9ERIC|nr:MAG2-interacting protein 2 [Camellia lanceoleosa]
MPGTSLSSFTFGIWSESHDVLGVVDDTDILYFIKANDGSLYEVEISQDPTTSVFSAHTSNNNSTLKEFSENVFCLNYHPETSLLAIVGGAASAPVTSSGNTGKLLPESVSILVQSLGCPQYQCWGSKFYAYELDADY